MLQAAAPCCGTVPLVSAGRSPARYMCVEQAAVVAAVCCMTLHCPDIVGCRAGLNQAGYDGDCASGGAKQQQADGASSYLAIWQLQSLAGAYGWYRALGAPRVITLLAYGWYGWPLVPLVI